jgi:membrane-associated protease RseP (regulator of RpoE activity)
MSLDSVTAMLNFDMVGRLRDNRLVVYGVATAAELRAIVDTANAVPPGPFTLKAVGDGFGPSDQASFYSRNVPVLFFFTDIHEDYHKATDVASKINVPGEGRVVDFAARIARVIADRPQRLTFTGAPPERPTMSPGSGTGVYFGSVPDMAAVDVKGVRLAGVTPGSPADRAGAKTGDVVVEFGGRPVEDLYQYTDALQAHAPGDVVQVVVLRAGQRVTLTATLGKRGT